MSKKQVRISKICLEIEGKKINLTLKQAQELKDVLNDTFGEGDVVVYHDRWNIPYWNHYTFTSPVISKGNLHFTDTICLSNNVAEEVTSSNYTLNLAVS